MKVCKQYKDLLQNILDNGIWREDPNRKDTKRLQIPFTTMSIDLREGFPMLTTKKMWWKGIVVETLWLLRGESNIKYLIDNGVNIWNKDAYNYYLKDCKQLNIPKGEIDSFEDWLTLVKKAPYKKESNYGDIGRMYGVQWRNWIDNKDLESTGPFEWVGMFESIDQLQKAITTIKENPLSSNIRIFGDNPADSDNQALPCCMDYMQFSCEPLSITEISHQIGDTDSVQDIQDKKDKGYFKHHYLDLTIHFKSSDVLLGLPWNIAQYALILEIIAKITNKIPRHLNIVANNVHLYDNQIEAAKEQIERYTYIYDLPTLRIAKTNSSITLDEYIARDFRYFRLKNYKSYPKLTKQPEMKSYE